MPASTTATLACSKIGRPSRASGPRSVSRRNRVGTSCCFAPGAGTGPSRFFWLRCHSGRCGDRLTVDEGLRHGGAGVDRLQLDKLTVGQHGLRYSAEYMHGMMDFVADGGVWSEV